MSESPLFPYRHYSGKINRHRDTIAGPLAQDRIKVDTQRFVPTSATEDDFNQRIPWPRKQNKMYGVQM